MKVNSKIIGFGYYLREFIIVAAGVMLALFISNLKDNLEAKKYNRESIETVKKEARANYQGLENIIQNHRSVVDTINFYIDDPVTIVEIFQKVNGIQFTTLSNTGLEFYSRSKISLIDFDIMTTLYQMEYFSSLVEKKLDRLADYAYTNLQSDTRESKMIVMVYLSDVVNSELGLMEVCKYVMEGVFTTETTEDQVQSEDD